MKDLKNIELNALPNYYDRCIKDEIRIYDDKAHTNFCRLNDPEHDVEC